VRRISPYYCHSEWALAREESAFRFVCTLEAFATGLTRIASNAPRTPLLSAALQNKTVTSVDVREIKFGPGPETGLHDHPCPVFAYIAEGEAVLEIKGHAPQKLPTGAAFHEPANTVILRFDNASTEKPMRFICFYLLEGQQELIEMLEQG
jgi:quercetin dioxygenase-like cupin family protein